MTPTFSLPNLLASAATSGYSSEWSPPMMTGIAPASAISRTRRITHGTLRSMLNWSIGALP
jgi:hypothetical protein